MRLSSLVCLVPCILVGVDAQEHTFGDLVVWGSNAAGGDFKINSNFDRIFPSYASDAFAALKHDGTVMTWGTQWYGGDSTTIDFSFGEGVHTIVSSPHAFASLQKNGSVITWGSRMYGGNSSGLDFDSNGGVKSIVSNDVAFAALKHDGTVIAWGDNPTYPWPNEDELSYGAGDTSQVDFSSGVKEIIPSKTAFAALKNDGTVVTWGDEFNGGDSASVDFESGGRVKQVLSVSNGFVAIKHDGSVVSWPDTSLYESLSGSSVETFLSNVWGWVALDTTGTFVAWTWPGKEAPGIDFESEGGVKMVSSTSAAFTVVKNDGSIASWGHPSYGGQAPTIDSASRGGARSVSSSQAAFALLFQDGSVVAWGNPQYGGDSSSVDFASHGEVKTIFSNENVFAALMKDNYVLSWGDPAKGGDSQNADFSSGGGVENIVSSHSTFVAIHKDKTITCWGEYPVAFTKEPVFQADLQAVFSTARAFAALKSDGSVVTWGDAKHGGDSSEVDVSSTSGGGVQSIASNDDVFVAIKKDGSIAVWGAKENHLGGDCSSVDFSVGGGVQAVFSNRRAFAALLKDGSVVTWGDPESGGHSTSVSFTSGGGVQTIISTDRAFAALKMDGTVVSWGVDIMGGDSSDVAGLSGVKELASTTRGFAALRDDGAVIMWGDIESLSQSPSNYVVSSGAKRIFSNDLTFAVLMEDGSVLTEGQSSSESDEWGIWGDPYYYGDANHGGDSSTVDFLSGGGTKTIQSTAAAFAALKHDGSVVTWGDHDFGGDSTQVDLSSGVVQLFSTRYAFAALKSEGTVLTWGFPGEGGDSSSVDLSSGGGVKTIYSTRGAFVAVKHDGTIVSWGDPNDGGQIPKENLSGVRVERIFANKRAFVAVKSSFMDCADTNLLIALDESLSVGNAEFERERSVLETALDILPIGQTAVALTRFGMEYSEIIPLSQMAVSQGGGADPNYVKQTVKAFFDSSVGGQKFTNFLPLFGAPFGETMSRLAQNGKRSTIMILSDGEPFMPGLRASKQACMQARDFKQENPTVNIVCFQADRKSRAKRFFRCACDAIWLAQDPRHNNPPEAVAAEMVQNWVCSPKEKQKDPCDAINYDTSLEVSTLRRTALLRRRACRQLSRNARGIDPMESSSTSLATQRVTKHCFWSKGR